MESKQLPRTYKYDVIADALYARELEYFHYEFDANNFEMILRKMPEGDERINFEKRLADTKAQMEKVDDIYRAIECQIDDKDEYNLAVLRMKAKRENV